MKKTLLFLIVAGLLFGAATDARSQVRDISWGTSAVGSSGHKALVSLAALLNREMRDYRIMVLPTPGAIVTVKGYATGQFGGYYGADIAFYELYNDINRFKGFKPQIKRYPVQSFWAYTMEVGVGISAKDRDTIKQWRDLSGRPVFTGPLPWDTRCQLERGLQALGVKHRYVEVDLATVGSMLEAGNIKGFLAYTAGETTPPPWIYELSLGTEWAILNPSKEEAELLQKAGFGLVEVKPEVFRRDVHVDKVQFLPFFYGFHVGLEVPEEDVYKMLTIIEKYSGELVKMDASFAQVNKDMRGLQRRGVESSVTFVPIHPGLAKYMKERGVWNAKWDARIAKGK
jgi:TRAP-type uncharacterized transport system substrate-binding protein